MKKRIFSILILIVCGIKVSAQCNGITGTLVIPDANFKDSLLNEHSIDIDNNGVISCLEAFNYTGILNVAVEGISDLTGIEAFTRITGLNCSHNNLTTLDVSNNKALTTLTCGNNGLSVLDVSENTALLSLDVTDNSLTDLDVSKNTDLTALRAGTNELTSLDVSGNTALREVRCDNNELIRLNVANGNNITFNILTKFISNPNLTCITVDDVSYANTYWGAKKDAIASYSLDCSCLTNAYLPDANFKDALLNNHTIDLNNDGFISCTEASSYTGVIDVRNKGITDLTGIGFFINVTELYCQVNDLVSLNVSNNPDLTVLQCGQNDLTELDVSKNTALTTLWVNNNDLTELDVSGNTALEALRLGINNVTSLDVSGNTVLKELVCSNNALTSLNVANGNNTNFNTITSFVNNPNLSCIEVGSTNYSNIYWADKKDITTFYSEDCDNCVINIPDTDFKAALITNTNINTNKNI